jgi:hypothetical protein
MNDVLLGIPLHHCIGSSYYANAGKSAFKGRIERAGLALFAVLTALTAMAIG